MPASDPDVSRPRLIRDASFLEADRREIARRRGHHNRLGFAYQVAFVRVFGRFPRQTPLEIDGEILRFAALQPGTDAETIHAYAGRQQTVSEHQQRIGEYLRLRAFEAADTADRLARFLEDEALRIERTASLLARARAWLRDEHVLAPADSVLRRAIGAARHKARALLTQRLAERLSAPMRDRLGRRQDSNLWPSAPEAGGAARHAVTPAARGEGGRLHSSGDASRASVSADALRARGGAGRRGPPKVRADVTRRRRS